MIRTRTLLISGLGAFALGVLAWLSVDSPSVAPPVVPAARAERLPRFAPGRAFDYHLRLLVETNAQVLGTQGEPIRGLTEIQGVLRLEGLPPHDGEEAVRVRFLRLAKARVEINGQDALEQASRDALERDSVLWSLGPEGELHTVALAETAAEGFGRLHQMLGSELSFARAEGSDWTRREPSFHGVFESHYTRLAPVEGRDRVQRDVSLLEARVPGADLLGYPPKVAGGRGAAFDESGLLVELIANESLTVYGKSGASIYVVNTELELALASEQAADPAETQAAIARLSVKRAPTEVELSARNEARQLEQRIDGLSEPELLATLDGALIAGKAADHNRFLWRSTGLIARDAKLIPKVRARFFEPKASSDGRGLVLDLLVGAGTAQAQQALLELLGSELASQDPARLHFRQRLALIQEPSPETLRFVETKASALSDWQDPARVSLGALGRTISVDQPAEARRFGDLLAAQLDAAATPRDQEILTLALGNLGDDRLAPHILPGATASEAAVRYATADALRSIGSEEAAAALVGLSQDRDPGVARRAFHSLGEHVQLSPATWSGLELAVRARTIQSSAVAGLVNMCSKGAKDPASPQRRILDLLLTQPLADRQLKGRILQMISP